MANFTNTFTGKGTGVLLPGNEGVQKSQQNLNDLITRAEEIKYKTYRENRDMFMKNANIDPVFVLSDAARKTISKRITDFNQRWGKRFQQSGGQLSDQDLMDMQTDKNLIIADQQAMQAQYELYLRNKDLVTKYPDKFDAESFARDTDNYMQTGVYDKTMPALKPISFGSYIRGLASKVKGEYEPIEERVGNQIMVKTRNIQDVGRFIEENMFSNDQATIGLLNDWNSLPQSEKKQWLDKADTNANKRYDELEKKNAIVEWAKERYKNDATVSSYTAPKNIARPKTTSGFIKTNPVSATNNKNAQYDIQGVTPISTMGGRVEVPDFMAISTVNPTPIFITIPEYYEFGAETGQAPKKLSEAESVQVEFLGYSPAKDLLFVKSKDIGTMINQDDIIALDASKYDQYLKNKFGIYRESLRPQVTSAGNSLRQKMEALKGK